MQLSTNFGPEIVDPSGETIEKAIQGLLQFPEEDFALLAASGDAGMFIQTVPTANDGSSFHAEYGTGDGTLYSIDELSIQSVIRFFQSFNNGDASWKTDPRWKNATNETKNSDDFFDSLKELTKETGRSLEEWVRSVVDSGLLSNPTDRSACRQWLITECGLSPERARTLVAYVQLVAGISDSQESQNTQPEFTGDETAALEAFELAHKEFVRGHFEQAAQQFLAIINTYPSVSEVASRARTYLEDAQSHLKQKGGSLPSADSVRDSASATPKDSNVQNLGLSGKAAKIATEKARFWEYDLFAQVIADEVEKANIVFAEKHATRDDGHKVQAVGSVADATKWFNERLNENRALIQLLSDAMNNQETAFGPPGTAGDVSAIVSLSRQVGGYCQTWAEWSQKASKAMVDPSCAEAVGEFQEYAQSVIEVVERFARDYIAQIDHFRNTPPGTKGERDARLKLPNISSLDAAVMRLGDALIASRTLNQSNNEASTAPSPEFDQSNRPGVCPRCRKGSTFFSRRPLNPRTGRCQTCDGEVARALEGFRKGLEQFLKDGLKPDDMQVLRQAAANSQINFDEVLRSSRDYSVAFLERFIEFFRKAGTMDDELVAYVEFVSGSILPANDPSRLSVKELATVARQHSAYVQDLRTGLIKPVQCDTTIYLQDGEKSFLDLSCTYRPADRPYKSSRRGQLVLTNKRWVLISFDGGMEFTWSKILTVEDTSEGIRLVLTTKKGSGTYEVEQVGLFQATVAALLRTAKDQPAKSRQKSASASQASGRRKASPPPPPPKSDSRSGPRDPYEVLGVNGRSTRAEITAAFRKLAQMYHPDKVESLAPEYREIAKKKMLEINVAYDSLMRKQ